MYGLAEEEKEEDKFKPVECPRCGIMNEPGSNFCSGCGLGLDERSVMEYDERQKQLKKAEELIGEKAIEEIIGERIHKELQELKKELINSR